MKMLEPIKCPRCGYYMDSGRTLPGSPERVKPKPGDLAICAACACPMQHLQRGARWLTMQEVMDMDREVRADLVVTVMAIVTARPSMVAHKPLEQTSAAA